MNNQDDIPNISEEGMCSSNISQEKLKMFIEEELPQEEQQMLRHKYRQDSTFRKMVDQYSNDCKVLEKQGIQAYAELTQQFSNIEINENFIIEQDLIDEDLVQKMWQSIQKKLQ